MIMKDEITEIGKRQPGDDRGTPGIEKQEDDEYGQNPAEEHGLLDVPAGVPDHDGTIAYQRERNTGRKFILRPLHHLLHRIHDPDRLPRNVEDIERYAGTPFTSASDRCSSIPSVTSATSASMMGRPLRWQMIIGESRRRSGLPGYPGEDTRRYPE